jgi:hypothetical protein
MPETSDYDYSWLSIRKSVEVQSVAQERLWHQTTFAFYEGGSYVTECHKTENNSIFDVIFIYFTFC